MRGPRSCEDVSVGKITKKKGNTRLFFKKPYNYNMVSINGKPALFFIFQRHMILGDV